MLLNVEAVTPAKTGKSLRVKANGEWYGANLKSGLQGFKGKIDAEVEDGEFGKWIQAYKPISGESHEKAAAASGTPPSTADNVAPWWMPFVSNTVAHAITAGHITDPNQINQWALKAAQCASAIKGEV